MASLGVGFPSSPPSLGSVRRNVIRLGRHRSFADPCLGLRQEFDRQRRVIDRPGEDERADHRGPTTDRRPAPLRRVDVCGTITGAAVGLHQISYISVICPMIMAVAMGMVLNSFRHKVSRRGLAFVSRPLLRFAIVLLGFQLSWGQIYDIGLLAAVVVVLSLTVTMVSTITRWVFCSSCRRSETRLTLA